jgi:hypothetical protein
MAIDEFLGSSQLSSVSNWQERVLYKEEAFGQYEKLNLSDAWYGSPFYGKIDESGRAIFPREEFLTQVDSPNLVMGLEFVEYAYKNLYMTYLLSLSAKYGIKNFNSHLVNITPQKGFESVHALYHKHQQNLYSLFLAYVNSNNEIRNKICTLKNFLNYYFIFLRTIIADFPITKTSFIKSNLCPPAISGLVFDIKDDLSHDEDNPKSTKFLQDPLFDDYVRHAVKYGFSIDKNAPWRLIARLSSTPMKTFISRFTLENVFDRYYYQSYKSEFDNFKVTATQFYNSFQAQEPSFTKTGFSKNSGKLFVNTIQRKYADEDTVASISNMFWLNQYYIIRMLEEGYSITPTQAKNNVQYLMRVYKRRGQDAAIEELEKKFFKMDKLAIPIERRKYFDYGPLNVQGVIYEDKKNQFLQQQSERSY